MCNLDLRSLWLSIMVCGVASSMASASDAKEAFDFEGRIAPLFEEHCVECHSADDQNGGLRLDHASALSAEVDSGKAPIVSGDPKASELIRRVNSDSEDDRMPPDGPKLTGEEIESLRQWIRSGADWPKQASEDSEDEATSHWAFQPRQQVAIPVDETGWASTDIDRLVAARRQKAGLSVAADADPIVLLRRATYDLTGFPPTPAEVDQFENSVKQDGLKNAFSQLIERLLASPSYGERWGRHWMDWVRYADTAGDNSDYPIPQAYLYRNYIIDSLNRDVPYDQFVAEQLAGDLMPADTQEQRNRQTIATGYIAMARRFGSLVERYPWHLTIEDTIDNVGRTMLGMTISCARCHDHKFDPVTTREYYGLYGFFASTQYPFPGIELFQTQQNFVSLMDDEATKKHLAEYQGKTDQLTKELKKQLERCRDQALVNAEREKDCSIDEKRQMREQLDGMLIKARHAGEKLAGHLKKIPDYPSAYAVSEATPTDARIQIKGEPTRPGGAVGRAFPSVLGGQVLDPEAAKSSSGRLELAQWITAVDNPLFARVFVNRVWQKHFGTGLVASTNDFGLRGDLPSHPELLDYLATEFINSGYSLKQLHRSMMNSRVYQISSIGDEANAKTDPNNRLFWRFNRQRLDAESLRDTLLVLSGQLDPVPQNEPYPFPDKTAWEFTQHHPFKGDYPNHKRSVYQMTKRLTVGTYLQTFDGADPNVCTGQRDQSVTSLQALYFFNDEFLHEQSIAFAKQLISEVAEQKQRTTAMFKKVLARQPSEAERELVAQHIRQATTAIDEQQSGKSADLATDVDERELLAWASVVRGMFRLNEFLYLD
ncbi:PSD1 and planctomycete cytochrome C domain-containing protein [Stieleria sp. JC731]|uniref:PSD1 and planctomycete cytochrome C domain-containing protein n=1 Tax=Pirellulaceae TaxID=2691357 RepID=UPI001E2DA5D1|nr:PSD1 and planctomycete cytochrome C domain-containing protein [Stieleria sp. JC731]MCC9600087.1 PSD1 and planctomycete cytochrome C domain-containing protein [Stieleria sp. JC731]